MRMIKQKELRMSGKVQDSVARVLSVAGRVYSRTHAPYYNVRALYDYVWRRGGWEK